MARDRELPFACQSIDMKGNMAVSGPGSTSTATATTGGPGEDCAGRWGARRRLDSPHRDIAHTLLLRSAAVYTLYCGLLPLAV